jgi:hypothetical protein
MPSEPLVRRLPIVVGVTGHRDVGPRDVPILAEAIGAVFSELQRAYPSTPLLLLTPLAQGADCIAAEVAQRRAIPYRVPLPMPLEAYRTDFSGESLARFDDLLAQADGAPYEMPFFEDNTAGNISEPERRAHQYALVGAHLARTAHVLIALWDGVASSNVGGTAQTVRFRALGIPRRYGYTTSVIEAPQTGSLYHIYTARTVQAALRYPVGHRTLRVRREGGKASANPAQAAVDIFADIDERPAATRDPFETIYERIDTFNRDCASIADAGGNVTDSSTKALMVAAERVATHYQHRFVAALQTLFGATGVALLTFELYAHVLPQAHPLVVIYFVASCVALWAFIRARRGRWQDRAQDYRALEIGLNVQQAWTAAGITDSVADFYIRRQRSELDWIRDAIRTAHYVDRRSGASEADAIATVRTFILGQYTYFAGSLHDPRAAAFTGRRRPGGAAREHRKATLHERLSNGALRTSFAVSAILIVYGMLAWLAPHLLAGAADNEGVHGAIIFVVASTAIAAAMFHDYPARRAHAQHARRYEAMAGMYRRALDALDAAEDRSAWRDPADGPRPSALDTARTCIRELGHEALNENGDWLLLHRELPIELLAVG